jgi:hypothetical protein
MASRTRYFLIGSALVVVVGLCTGLVAYYGGALPGRTTAMAEFDYLPEDSVAVAFADVRDIMDSGFRQRLRQILPTGEDKDRLQAETGIDIERDIDTVVLGVPQEGQTNARPLVILRGRFDAAKIEALAATHGATSEVYRNTRILAAPASGADLAGGPSLAFLESGLLALGDAAAIRRAIDAAATRGGVAGNEDLMRAVAGIQGTGNAWIVGRTTSLSSHPGMPAQVAEHLSAVEWIAVGANVDEGVRAILRAEARDDQAGEDLRGVINGALSAARLFAGQDARIGSALGSLQMAGTGRVVEVSFTAPAEMIDLLQQMRAPTVPDAPEAPVSPTAP